MRIFKEYDTVYAIARYLGITIDALYEHSPKNIHLSSNEIMVSSDIGHFYCETFEDTDGVVYMKVCVIEK